MEATTQTQVTVQTTVNAPMEKVWNYWSAPEHITKWNSAHPDWHSPSASNDLKTGGKFSFRMEAKDGSMGFDFSGVYDEVVPHAAINYTMEDGRKVSVTFEDRGSSVHITETFDAEQQNPVEMQRDGWQAIMDNFKNYTEHN